MYNKFEDVYFIITSELNTERMVLAKGIILFHLQDDIYSIAITEIVSKQNVLNVLCADTIFDNLKSEKSFRTIINKNTILDINKQLTKLVGAEDYKYRFLIETDYIFRDFNSMYNFFQTLTNDYIVLFENKIEFLKNNKI
jgi:hypothetical protein